MSFISDLLTGVAVAIDAAGIGLTWRDGEPYDDDQTGIFLKTVPPSPDRLVVLTAYGISDDPTLSDSVQGLQVRSRGVPQLSTDCDDIDDAVFGFLQNTVLDLTTGIRIVSAFRTSTAPLGQDPSNRFEVASSYALSTHRPSTHRF